MPWNARFRRAARPGPRLPSPQEARWRHARAALSIGNQVGSARLIALFAKLRWAVLVLGPAMAFAKTPPPISVPAVLAVTVFVCLYNLPLSMAGRLPARWLDRVALASVFADIAVSTSLVLLTGNEPGSRTIVLLSLVGFEVSILYVWRGAILSAGAILAIAGLQVEQTVFFGLQFDLFDLVFMSAVVALVPLLGAGAASLIARQQRELAESAKRLGESESLLRTVLDSTAVGISRVSVDGIILGCNSALAAMFRSSEVELVGRPLEEFADSGDETRGMAPYEELRRGNAAMLTLTQRYHLRDGKSFSAQLTATLVKGPAGEPAYYVVVLEDITAQKNAERAKDTALGELGRLNTLKSNFVSVVSHEFRTALVGIMGFADLMQGEDLPADDVKEIARGILQDSERLNRLVTDMLDLEKMQDGRMPISLADCNLNDLVTTAVGHIPKSAKHSLKLDLDPSVAKIPADRDRLTQVMANLLGNAVKFSPAGGEIVVASRSDGDAVHISVQDPGVGIPADSLRKVFDRYSRLDDDATRHVGGTGLGLPIAKEIVELHGGRIWATAEPGHGATFHFTLPRVRGQAGRVA